MQGYEGIMHGGLLSALLDTAMAHCLLHENIEAMTGELNVRFIDPVAYDSTMAITAWVDSSLPPLYHLKSQIKINDKIVCIGFGLGDKIDLIKNKKAFTAAYAIDENHWNGNVSLQLKLKDIKA